MLDIKLIRQQPELVRRSIQLRNLNPDQVNLDRLLELDASWRSDQAHLEELRGQRNTLSASIKKLSPDERKDVIDQVKAIKQQMGELEKRVEQLKADRDALHRQMPNLLAEDVPEGKTDEDNLEISRWGEIPQFDFEPRNHVELGQITDTIDFERGAKVAGSNFYYLKHEAALLELALCGYAASKLVPQGFIPFYTPDLAHDHILEGIGFSPRGPETQVYSIENMEMSLVGTAEITLGGYHSDEILDADQLPLRYLGFSHCFRTEAGAHGRESKGLYRVHQFSKAEMFVFCRPQDSPAIHDQLRETEEQIMQELNIPYRVVNVCSGDLGAPALKKYDIEAWMPGRGRYGEVTSCSNCTDFQARRLNVRFRPQPKASPQFVHMLNGTALAVSRTLIAIYENYQQEDGSICIPSVLSPWIGGFEKIPVRA
jgi:seryl-tRNA synthetase